QLLYISAFINFIVMFFFFMKYLPAESTAAGYIKRFRNVFSGIKLKNVLISLLIFLTTYFIQRKFSNSTLPDEGSIWNLVYYISLYSSTKPLVFYVTAVTYFGVFFAILAICYSNFKKHLYNLGWGVYISFILTFLILFATDTRLIINFFPFIILLSVLVLKDIDISKRLFILLTLFSFVLSKIYIPMYNIPGVPVDKFEFPDQLFFMNLYTISVLSYIIQGSVILIISVFIFSEIRKCRSVKNYS
ncbi:MAG TPA: hypothetical protein PKD83_14155, partial [Ignavibacteria bacterium]|nr:hypothetical protein [Ignavibacteria bacterium]